MGPILKPLLLEQVGKLCVLIYLGQAHRLRVHALLLGEELAQRAARNQQIDLLGDGASTQLGARLHCLELLERHRRDHAIGGRGAVGGA